MVEMDGVDGNHATLPQTRKGADYHFSAGRECDCTVEHHGWLFIFFANPGCAKRSRKLPMRFTSGYDINLAFPRLQNGDRQTCRAAKTKESDSLSLLNPSHSQAAEADDAGAQQRSDMSVIQARGKRKSEVSARQNIFGIAAIHGVSGKDRLIAEIFHAVMAVPAVTIDATHPGNADTRSQW